MPQKEKRKTTKGDLSILMVGTHMGYRYLIQEIKSVHIYQTIIFYKDNFYQVYAVITPAPGEQELTDPQRLDAMRILEQGAHATIEELELKHNKKHKKTKDQTVGDVLAPIIDPKNNSKLVN